jgi:CRISPR-associated protein Cmr2
MSRHLLLLTLGPVQEFIAQARRTRDLWYGSHLLSELGRAAARALLEGGADLIFPALTKGNPELAPCPSPLRPGGKSPLNIANKLLAEVPAGIDPARVARDTREAVMRFWREDIAVPVKVKCAGLLADNIDSVWTEQIDTFIEFLASWAPLGEYSATRRRVEQAIVARKSLRGFAPWTSQRGNVPKSSLDGARETVLRPPEQREPGLVQRYRIADDEQLDAVGLVKRAGGEPNQFVPVVNVAFACWVDLAAREASREFEALKAACEATGVSRVARPDLPCAKQFPYDASVLLPSRWRAVFKEQGLETDGESWGRRNVWPLLEKLAEPYPYVACLVADGDHMGRAIDHLATAEAHRAFSAALSKFAVEARRIVEQDRRGALIYTGGDDVLAFVPVPEALACADALRREFASVVAAACEDLPSTIRPTLSIGLGIGHVMESMGDLLGLGREAEREAKRSRNTLAVIVDKRSGRRRLWHAPWGEDPVTRLRADAALLESRLSSRKVYEVARALMRLPKPGVTDDPRWMRVLALEVQRVLLRVGEGGMTADEVGLPLEGGTCYATVYEPVWAWVERLLIARTFAMATPGLRRREKVSP